MRTQLLTLCTLCLLLTGCASLFEKETEVALTIEASEQINPGNLSNSNPLFVQVVQLKDIARFQKAELLSLYKNLSTELGDELVYFTPPFPIKPGEKIEQLIQPEPGSNYMGLIYYFNQFDQATTRHWSPIIPHKYQCIRAEISNTTATIRQKCP